MTHYTARVIDNRRLELPQGALDLVQPGQEIEINIEETAGLAVKPNSRMLAALDEIARRQEGRRHTDGSQTDRFIREGRAGKMYGPDPD